MRFLGVLVCLMLPFGAIAEMGSLLGGDAFATASKVRAEAVRPTRNSLFAGRQEGTLLAPYPEPVVRPAPQIAAPDRGPAVEVLRHVIGRAESPRAGYDAVQHGARIKPRKLPTHMTLGEIYDWIAATPGQPHAIGRYQFIPTTLRRVAARVGAGRGDVFSPQLQDRLADVLLAEAGFHKYLAGQISQRKFMDNLAGIWAGLPGSNGRSRYHGYAGNRATITLAYFKSELSKIGPS